MKKQFCLLSLLFVSIGTGAMNATDASIHHTHEIAAQPDIDSVDTPAVSQLDESTTPASLIKNDSSGIRGGTIGWLIFLCLVFWPKS